MKYLIDSLDPLQQKISERSAYLGTLIALGFFVFSLFLPWASVPAGIRAIDGGAASGWSEGAFFSLLPFGGLLLSLITNRKSSKPRNLLIYIVLAFALLGFDNVIGRAQWHPIGPGADDLVLNTNYGSSLDIGFWLGFLALVAISVFGLAWSLHRAATADSVL